MVRFYRKPKPNFLKWIFRFFVQASFPLVNPHPNRRNPLQGTRLVPSFNSSLIWWCRLKVPTVPTQRPQFRSLAMSLVSLLFSHSIMEFQFQISFRSWNRLNTTPRRGLVRCCKVMQSSDRVPCEHRNGDS